MVMVIGRTYNGNAVQFEIDGRPVEADASALAEAAIGSASLYTATAVSGAVTLNNASCGTITSESLSTATGASYTLTFTSNLVKAGSVVLANATYGTSTHGTACITHITPAAGSVVIIVKNIDASNAFNGTIKVGFMIAQ